MANEIRLIILIIGLIFIGWILWDGLRRKQNKSDSTGEFGDQPYHATQQMPSNESDTFQDPLLDSQQPIQFDDLPEFDNDQSQQSTDMTTSSDSDDEVSASTTTQQAALPKLILFHIVARRKRGLGGFSLLQVLLDHHFRYGDMGIFHYYEKTHQEGKRLFSLASATKTGDFPISDMASFQCKGLILFMYPEEHAHPAKVFDEMVKVAEQLAESLEADLKLGRDKLEWNEANLAHWYRQLF